ncbi:hypothetical protein [Thermomonas carbonis]|jgi:hypothetical protein|uniref:Uncharacterized protein n=1 Tax=Thermomonas carbonis TaxID=1463158 RepID=A0A7G9SNG8_9GAMM|nr:hypothetical protein [Thermomonas carbonis]QNN69393.1 hypothetical protein H9L16_12010 [Thermomonas carbonis]GHC13362.1 hypothetical protein GCM10010080_31010 [Thermomonas carbonis]
MKLLVAASLLASCLSAHAGQDLQPINAEHAKVIQLTRALEERPLDPTARDARAWLLQWAEATPDVTILVCDILGPLPGTNVPNGPELLVQSMFGNAAFQLQHPESKGDPQKTQMAGVVSLLAAYRTYVKTDPGASIPHFDAWLAELAAGTLQTKLAPTITEKCSG